MTDFKLVEKQDKLANCETFKQCQKLLWQWAKQDAITLSQFTELQVYVAESYTVVLADK